MIQDQVSRHILCFGSWILLSCDEAIVEIFRAQANSLVFNLKSKGFFMRLLTLSLLAATKSKRLDFPFFYDHPFFTNHKITAVNFMLQKILMKASSSYCVRSHERERARESCQHRSSQKILSSLNKNLISRAERM